MRVALFCRFMCARAGCLFVWCSFIHLLCASSPFAGCAKDRNVAPCMHTCCLYLHPWHMSGRPPGLFSFRSNLHYIPNPKFQFKISCFPACLSMLDRIAMMQANVPKDMTT